MNRGRPPSRLAARHNAATRVQLERDRQNLLHGCEARPLGMRLPILIEEVGEVGKAMQENGEASVELLDELVQVAATALRWAEELLMEVER